jgi:phage-related protein
VRAEQDDYPQDDGSAVHPRFRSGMLVTLPGLIIAEAGVTARLTLERQLRGYTNTLLRPTALELVSSARLAWTPSDGDDLMLDKVHLETEVAISKADPSGYYKAFELSLRSPYAYAMLLAQSSQAIADGTPETIANGGNVETSPVLRIDGPFTTFTAENTTTGETLTLTSGVGVASGHYVELSFFDRTAYVDGDGADLNAAVAGSSVWWKLPPGSSSIAFTGASGTLLWNDAYVG